MAGREDGTLMQYDPDLKEKRKWDYPTIFSDDSYQGVLSLMYIPYFFSYKTGFSFQKNPKSLDPSYKMDLDIWDCF